MLKTAETAVDWVGLVNAFSNSNWTFIGYLTLLAVVAIALSRTRY